MIIVAYFTIAFCVAAVAAATSYWAYEEDPKFGRVAANVALLCLFWPVLAVYGVVRLVPTLARRAGWVTR